MSESPIRPIHRDPFRLLVDSVKEYAIYLLDRDGRVATWNSGAERIKGWHAGEIIGKHFSTFYPEEDIIAGKCERELAIALEQGQVEDEGWRVRKDRTRFWANAVITTLRDDDGRHVGFAKVTRDLTDRNFRTFVEAANAIIWTTDASGQPNADSPTWRAFTGQGVDEWRGRRGWEPLHPDDREAMHVAWSRAKAEARLFEAEFRLRRRDGVYVWMACRATPILGEGGDVREWFGVTYDISDRKNAEMERARAEKRWTTTLASIGDAVVTTDLQGRVTFMNPVAEKLTGVSLVDAGGRALSEIFPIVNEETRSRVEDPVAHVLRDGSIVGLANRTVLLRPDGTDVPIDDSAAPIRGQDGILEGVVLVFRDVADERREQARRTFLARASEALMASSDYRESLAVIAQLAVPRLADWCTVEVVEPGQSGTRQLALAHADPAKVADARELGQRYPPDPNAKTGVPQVIRTGRSELYREIPEKLLEEGAVDEEHLRMIRALKLRSAMVVPLRGRERIFGALTFIHAESGRTYGADDLAFAEELAGRAALVIERRRLEEERAALLERERFARAEAEAANRAKDEFLATVSHELRTPLNAILGWTTILRRRNVTPDFDRALAVIERNARAQVRLVEDILDVSRIISGKLRLDIAPADVRQAVKDAAEAVRPGAEAKGVGLTVSIAPNVETLYADPERLQQIVWNLVANAVKFTSRGGSVAVDVRRTESHVQIVVSDSGEGIDASILETIFEPFRQADSSTTRMHGGLGLGLAIVRQLVQAHGGTIRAESRGRGYGATFMVDLPSRSLPAAVRNTGRAALGSTPAVARLDGLRLLVVDDEEDARELLREVLSGRGASVETAASSAEGFAKFRSGSPDVILSDIGMPGEDGLMLVRKIRALPAAEGGRTIAVALTAYAGDEDAQQAFAAGFQAHISKPVELDALIATVAGLAGVPLAAS